MDKNELLRTIADKQYRYGDTLEVNAIDFEKCVDMHRTNMEQIYSDMESARKTGISVYDMITDVDRENGDGTWTAFRVRTCWKSERENSFVEFMDYASGQVWECLLDEVHASEYGLRDDELLGMYELLYRKWNEIFTSLLEGINAYYDALIEDAEIDSKCIANMYRHIRRATRKMR